MITTHRVYSHRISHADQGLVADRGLARSSTRSQHPSASRAPCVRYRSRRTGRVGRPRPDVLNHRTLAPITDVLKRYASGEHGLGEASRGAVQEVRRRVGQSSLPNAALVVIDAAHNLKSTQPTIYRALMSILSNRFEALLFLTATPFQLGRNELPDDRRLIPLRACLRGTRARLRSACRHGSYPTWARTTCWWRCRPSSGST